MLCFVPINVLQWKTDLRVGDAAAGSRQWWFSFRNLWLIGDRELSSAEDEEESPSETDSWCIGALFFVAVTTSECISYHRV